ncbi:MAG: CotH kinase family protein [Trueperaceae bacterium]
MTRFWLLLVLLLTGCLQPINVPESNLPIIKIDTAGETIPDNPKIQAKMQVIAGEGVNAIGGTPNAYDGFIGIERRGTSSQSFAKKQYSLETWDEAGEELEVELLGMPKESDWILYAPFTDKSLIRNNLVYQTARDLGYYASRQLFTNVFLNEDYQGVYVLLERIKRDKNRVDISKVSENLTGGYLLEFQCGVAPDPDEVFFQVPRTAGDGSCVYIIQYPSDEELTAERKSYITDYVTQFAETLYGPNFQDPSTGFRSFTDELTFIDYMLISDIFKNPDAFNRSTYFYKDKEDVLKPGPLWDFDLALGNNTFGNAGEPEGFLLTNRPWTDRLLQDSTFAAAYVERYRSLRQTHLSTNNLYTKIDEFVRTLGDSSQHNFER